MTLSHVDAEFLLLNLETAVRVRQRSQFFLWVQGQLQSLIPHRLLICAARGGDDDRSPYRVDFFGREPLNREQSLRVGFERGGFLEFILGNWQRSGGVAWFVEPGEMSASVTIPAWLDSMHLGWHGTMDTLGAAETFFVVASDFPFDRTRHTHFFNLLTPHLSNAFVRTVLAVRTESPRRASLAAVLTERQLEILRFVQQGKSNSEIGRLLDISPLTVKNHVQTLLRKLNAQNRAQAVSFGIEQRLIQPRSEVPLSAMTARA